MEIEKGVIPRGRRPGQITPSEISIILQMIQKPNSIIVLLFIQNNSQFKNKAKTCLPPSMLSSSSIVHVQGCSAPQIFSKQQMSPFELSSCCSCHVFSYNFAQFLLLKRVKCLPFFVFTTKTTQPHPQVFSVNGALTCKNAAFLMSFPRQTQNSYKFSHQYDDQMMTGYGGLCHG